MIYLLILCILIHFAIFHDVNGNTRNRKLHFNIIFIAFFLLTGLRHGIGGDTYQFRIFWDLLPTFDSGKIEELTLFRYDIGWIFLCYCMKSIFGSFVFLQLLVSFFLNKGIIKIVERYSRYPFATLLLFYLAGDQFYHIEMTFMRQSVSVAIFLNWGIGYLENRKNIQYIATVIVASLMHFSAAFLIVLPFFWNIDLSSRKKRKRIIWSLVLFFCLSLILYNSLPFVFYRALERLGNDAASINVSDNEFVRVFNTIYQYIAYFLVIVVGHAKLKKDIPVKGIFILSIFIAIIAPYAGDTMRLFFFVIIFVDMMMTNVIVPFSFRNKCLFLTYIVAYIFVSNILIYQRYASPANTFMIYPYYSWLEEEPLSHKRYFRERINDGYTISHQIYDYDKVQIYK